MRRHAARRGTATPSKRPNLRESSRTAEGGRSEGAAGIPTSKLLSAREVNPVISFGVAIAPNAIVSLLGGVTYSRTALPTGDPAVQNDAGFWTVTFGIGGNLDIINAFRR